MTSNFFDFILAKLILLYPSTWYDINRILNFERKFADWNGSAQAYTFNSGRVALSACIYALDLSKDDVVMVPGYTCVVVPNAFKFAGVKVIYYDIELDTYGPNFEDIVTKYDPEVKAILIHHLYGLVCKDLSRILSWAFDNKIKVIEDCAHAMGASFRNKRVGNFGDVSFFSTEQSKSISTVTGGIAVTNSIHYSERLKIFQSKLSFPSHEKVASILNSFTYFYLTKKFRGKMIFLPMIRYFFNQDPFVSTSELELKFRQPKEYFLRMSAAQALLGRRQLARLDGYNKRRRRTANQYRIVVPTQGFRQPVELESSKSVYLRYPLFCDKEEDKRKVSIQFDRKTIPIGYWFLSKLHPSIDSEVVECKNADTAVKRVINLPTLGV